ncbi:MAG: hypothetical protein IV100_15620, partial [Myxococcales bacterium]|nr:hypothetical protein [Myxococcales bacterium]
AEKPLADSGDFQFMRARYPFSTDAAVEDGFVFVSDAFVAKAVSPRSRILEARRMAALADLRAVGYGTLLHGLLSGTAATTREALLGAGVLAEADWKHADGTEITLDADKGPSSTVWGRPSFMTPLDELDIGKVSESEKLAYDRFRDTYQNYWRTFIDPIGLRIDVDPAKNRIAFDMAIMPLIDGTDYSDLREKAGDASYVPATADGIAQWTIGIGEKSSLRRDIDGLAGLLGRTDINFSWLGDFAFAGMMGGGAVNDLAILSGEVPEIGERRAGRDRDMVPVLDKAPLYAGVQVKNPLAFAATLAALRGFIQTAAPGMLEWGDGGTYRDVPITRVGAKTSNFDLGHDADLVYAIPAGVFVVSFDRGALDRLIDQVLDGTQVRLPKEGEANASPTQADFRVAVGEDDPSLRTLGYLVMEGEAVRQWQVAHRDAELFVRTFGVLPVGDAGKRKALAYLGFEPAVTQGGAFELAGNGRLTHSIYGTIAEPNLVALPVEGSPLGKLIDGLASLGLQLGFEGEGQTSGLHVTGAWTRTK